MKGKTQKNKVKTRKIKSPKNPKQNKTNKSKRQIAGGTYDDSFNTNLYTKKADNMKFSESEIKTFDSIMKKLKNDIVDELLQELSTQNASINSKPKNTHTQHNNEEGIEYDENGDWILSV